MQHVDDAHPTYAGNFVCIGPQCEDTCCGDWDIPLDKITYLQYRQFPADKLGSLVAHFVSRTETSVHDSLYASIRRKPNGSCPFLAEDRLCEIQRHYGAQLLSSTCSTYPRALAVVSGTLEGSLSLSCPEAARQVLLQEHSTQKNGEILSGEFRTDNVFAIREQNSVEAGILPIRALVVDLIRDRSRPLWHRLLMIAALCGRLDGSSIDDPRAVTHCLALYRKLVGRGNASELDQFSAGVASRLELTIALSNQRCQDPDCGRRFKDVFWDFIEGIGSADSEGAEEDIDRLRNGIINHLEPLLNASPFLLENYLLNYIYQHLFPFGRAGSDRFVAHTMFEEAVLLILQFSWMTTLLGGVAARFGTEFSTAHLVTTVQSLTRAVEHKPQILEDALEFVRSRDLDTLPGLARLLRT